MYNYKLLFGGDNMGANIWRKMDTRERKELLKEVGNSYSRAEMIACLDDDEEKIALIDAVDDDKKYIVIESLESDMYKLSWLDSNPRLSDKDRSIIIASLKDDSEKIKALDDLCNKRNRIRAVLNDPTAYYERRTLAGGEILTDKEATERLKLQEEHLSSGVDRIIASVQSKDRRKGLLSQITDPGTRKEVEFGIKHPILHRVSEASKRAQQMKKSEQIADEYTGVAKEKRKVKKEQSKDDKIKYKISDTQKIKYIDSLIKRYEELEKEGEESKEEKIATGSEIINCICTLKDDDTKLGYLQTHGRSGTAIIDDVGDKIVKSLKSDEKKMKILENGELFPERFAGIAESLSTDESKKRSLKLFDEKFAETLGINYDADDRISAVVAKSGIVRSMEDDKFKGSFISELYADRDQATKRSKEGERFTDYQFPRNRMEDARNSKYWVRAGIRRPLTTQELERADEDYEHSAVVPIIESMKSLEERKRATVKLTEKAQKRETILPRVVEKLARIKRQREEKKRLRETMRGMQQGIKQMEKEDDDKKR